MSASTNK